MICFELKLVLGNLFNPEDVVVKQLEDTIKKIKEGSMCDNLFINNNIIGFWKFEIKENM